ncbi:MAG: glycoside hydrolase family 127 protein [Clostridia bacterium]|nr:glycoside hydrolase family 127 protein [Clostridia bacterium]
MKAIPFPSVTLADPFWKSLSEKVRRVTVPAVYDRFAESGRIGTLSCKGEEGLPKPHVFWGSDVFKWIEGAAYHLKTRDDPALRERVFDLVERIEEGTAGDGYYNSYYNTTGEARFSDRDKHELYSLGHLIEAAVALREATGDERLLKIAVKNTVLVDRLFRVEDGAAFRTPGHEEIELALVRLYRATGEERFLDLARFFLDQRGSNEKDAAIFVQDDGAYCQSHKPVRDQREAVGHAVRAAYLYCAMTDLAGIDDDAGLREAVFALFDDVTTRKSYLTGGIGSQQEGECFTLPYHLPNATAYAETCAAIGMALWAGRMALLTPDGRFGDVVERVMYNGMLSGLSLSGDAFFYENHLAMDSRSSSLPNKKRYSPLVRQANFRCSCCPPNLVRFIPSLPGLFYTRADDRIFVYQYPAAETDLGDGRLSVTGDYLGDGRVTVSAPGKRLALRKPGWCRRFTASRAYREEKGFLWFDVDTVTITFDLTPFFVTAATAVREDAGRVALMRGPVVYCLEGQDQKAPLHALFVDPEVVPQPDGTFYGGLPVLVGRGTARAAQEALYAFYEKKVGSPADLRFIPYYTFANRGADDMQVWLPLT